MICMITLDLRPFPVMMVAMDKADWGSENASKERLSPPESELSRAGDPAEGFLLPSMGREGLGLFGRAVSIGGCSTQA